MDQKASMTFRVLLLLLHFEYYYYYIRVLLLLLLLYYISDIDITSESAQAIILLVTFYQFELLFLNSFYFFLLTF